MEVAPGVALAMAVGTVATLVGYRLPLVGGPVAGVVLGAVLTIGLRPLQRWPRLVTGVKFSGSRILQCAVVLLGAQVSLVQVLRVGWDSLPVMLGTLAVCFIAAVLLGRLLRVDKFLTVLVGVGTAICGASAIAAIVPVIRPSANKVAYALSTVFIFNFAAILTFPWIGHLLGMSQEAFGVFAGTAVNDTSSVVAAAATFGVEATDVAIVVKLARTLMIIPIVIGLSYWVNRQSAGSEVAGFEGGEGSRIRPWTLLPWFLVGFIILTLVNPILPDASIELLTGTAVLFITIALSAIGLSTDTRAIFTTGPRAVILGGALWIIVAATSLIIQTFTTGLT